MNIHDIAKIAKVSPSTVSKVMNNKDSDISEKTRKKVLEVAREYQYTPYSTIKNNLDIATGNIGIILPCLHSGIFPILLSQIQNTLSKYGYSLIVYCSEWDQDLERKGVELLLQKNVEGILFYPSFKDSDKILKESDKKIVYLGKSTGIFPRYYWDYKNVAYMAIKHLISNNHRRIGCIFDENYDEFLQGYKDAITEAQIRFDQSLIIRNDNEDFNNFSRLINSDIFCFFCGNIDIAFQFYNVVNSQGIKIPVDISIIAYDDKEMGERLIPNLTTVTFPIQSVGKNAAETIIKLIETGKTHGKEKIITPQLMMRESVSRPKDINGETIAVIGSLNMDTIFNVKHIPEKSETVMAEYKLTIPGGKGANQAVGIGKLKGQVYMIGRLGNDQKGREIYSSLLKNHVNTDGIVFDNRTSTGSAYISVDIDGNSSIMVHAGANNYLDIQQIENAENILNCAKYALIQTEIPIDVVKYSLKLFCKKNINAILKPAPAKNLPDICYKNLFMIIPNESEANKLCKHTTNVEEQAVYFLEKGVKNVIITMAERGCYYSNGKTSAYFDAIKVKTIDSTGASDSFISALVVKLAEGADMASSIKFAMYAASISVTREGVQSALPLYHEIPEHL